MLFLYNTGIYFYTLFIRIASLRNKKAAAWISGRKGLIQLIESRLYKNKRYTWFHFASLGEFEQGRPVLERLKSENPELPIIITFFSPSGYEIRKDYALADFVFYLPADTRTNAKEFIRLLNPEMAIFTKYDYWYHYFEELHKNNIPLYVISGIFRKEQVFFKWYGGLHRKMLKWVSHIFVQDECSRELLEKIQVRNVTVSGDTRFDRVAENILTIKKIPLIEEFCGDKSIFIAGSTWPEDEKLLHYLVKKYPDWKFIIAPHEVSDSRINELKDLFTDHITYSAASVRSSEPGNQQTLIIDNIGILSSVYQYGKMAYIGGGFGKGIHNTQEALAFGLPVIFGPEYLKFKEAVDLVSLKGAISISNAGELESAFLYFIANKQSGDIARNYIQEHTGATRKIIEHIKFNV
ncbi:MAG: glycosyltransferase N-terminal domain-containing protein [Daejeonella sp.]|uniref:3-deoxy-D-manno-octulosonic acid transferase n=1 Tax=Daejeonella sp. TaxID=2805397 RepID=UPI002734A0D3|nr:glycosyltransferase N-terminal domain-containing protein [Daejeonella sp.]MDP3469165.1 glycosyltransferase N-terminal domain-containing protein [Daejeonella sp.]